MVKVDVTWSLVWGVISCVAGVVGFVCILYSDTVACLESIVRVGIAFGALLSVIGLHCVSLLYQIIEKDDGV
jgi:E3 ubiquitin-protein ligase DOA10